MYNRDTAALWKATPSWVLESIFETLQLEKVRHQETINYTSSCNMLIKRRKFLFILNHFSNRVCKCHAFIYMKRYVCECFRKFRIAQYVCVCVCDFNNTLFRIKVCQLQAYYCIRMKWNFFCLQSKYVTRIQEKIDKNS